jgi:hypothetical protein
MAISEAEITSLLKNKDIILIGDRLITVPKKKEKGFFHAEMDIPEKEIDELLDDEVSQWIE